jgi:hypothetical protein
MRDKCGQREMTGESQMVFDRMKRAFSGLRQKMNALAKRDELTRRQYKLVLTDPPRYAGHFRLFKDELVPFALANPAFLLCLDC